MKYAYNVYRARLRATAIVLGIMSVAFPCGAVRAQLPVSGRPVPELKAFDDAMQSYMSTMGITAGVLAVSVDGCIVYQRGFGYLIPPPGEVNLPENTPMRLATRA